ncbi:MAG: hypothetical protein MJE66_02900 [Proteobacteria bacterium]|nr:hypothetical protein [Pseudomonadota bacterium]
MVPTTEAGWSVEAMVALATQHARVEAQRDLEATMATLVPSPFYEWQPMGWIMQGRDAVTRYYEHLFANFIPRTRDVRLLGEWASETGVAQEYEIHVAVDGGAVEPHRVIGILFAEGRLLGGERIYTSERCARLMAGDALIDEIAGLASDRASAGGR